jgi:hypothetical protein
MFAHTLCTPTKVVYGEPTQILGHTHHLPGGLAEPGEEAGAVAGGPSRMTLGSGAGRLVGAGWGGAGVWLGVAAEVLPTATGGGMSPSSMELPFRTEANRFSSV